MIPDIVEYGQLQTGRRNEGIYYGLWFFVQKLGMAASAAINGAVLSATGFRQSAGGAGDLTSPRRQLSICDQRRRLM